MLTNPEAWRGYSRGVATSRYFAWHRYQTSLDKYAAYVLEQTSGGARIGRVEPAFFDVLGLKAATGRTFSNGDCQDCAVSAKASYVGDKIRIDGRWYRVVGSLPPAFRFGSTRPAFWIPFEWGHAPEYVGVVGLLRLGRTVESAARDLGVGVAPLSRLERDASLCLFVRIPSGVRVRSVPTRARSGILGAPRPASPIVVAILELLSREDRGRTGARADHRDRIAPGCGDHRNRGAGTTAADTQHVSGGDCVRRGAVVVVGGSATEMPGVPKEVDPAGAHGQPRGIAAGANRHRVRVSIGSWRAVRAGHADGRCGVDQPRRVLLRDAPVGCSCWPHCAITGTSSRRRAARGNLSR